MTQAHHEGYGSHGKIQACLVIKSTGALPWTESRVPRRELHTNVQSSIINNN